MLVTAFRVFLFLPHAPNNKSVRRPLRYPLPHLNNPPRPFQQVLRLMRGQAVLVEQFQDVVNDRVLGLGEQLRLREGRLRDSRTGILAAELSDDVVAVLLRADALLFQQSGNRGNLPPVGDRRFFEGHAVAFGALLAHFPFGFHARASFCASAIWAGVICLASASRSSAAGLSPFTAARLYHL